MNVLHQFSKSRIYYTVVGIFLTSNKLISVEFIKKFDFIFLFCILFLLASSPIPKVKLTTVITYLVYCTNI